MLRKTFFLLLALSAARFLISCCGYSKREFYFRWTKATVKPVKFVDALQYRVPASDSLAKDSAGLLVQFGYEKVASVQLPDYGYSAAMAWSCPDPASINRDTLVSIDVTTRFPFDNTHPAGSSLNDLPIAFLSYNDSLNRYRPVNEQLRRANGSYNSNPFSPDLVFRFTRTNPFAGRHRLILTLTTVSGRVLQDSVSLYLY